MSRHAKICMGTGIRLHRWAKWLATRDADPQRVVGRNKKDSFFELEAFHAVFGRLDADIGIFLDPNARPFEFEIHSAVLARADAVIDLE